MPLPSIDEIDRMKNERFRREFIAVATAALDKKQILEFPYMNGVLAETMADAFIAAWKAARDVE